MDILEASGNTIGGASPGAGNLISGNTLVGLLIEFAAATDNLVQGNLIGTDATGSSTVPNGNGVVLSSGANTIGGEATGAGNVISGNSGDGIDITAEDNLVEGNRIGTDVSGDAAIPNGTGVDLGSTGNTIGGTSPGAGNLIRETRVTGCYISGANTSGNLVEGNQVGMDASRNGC